MTCPLTNLEVLRFVLGWQGRTLRQAAETIGCSEDDILSADWERMQGFCRDAQAKRRARLKQEAD